MHINKGVYALNDALCEKRDMVIRKKKSPA